MVNELERELGDYKLDKIFSGDISVKPKALDTIIDGKIETPFGMYSITGFKYEYICSWTGRIIRLTYPEYMELDQPKTLEGKAIYTKKN